MSSQKKGILELYKSKATVFTFKDIALYLNEDNFNNLKSRIKYFVDKGYLFRQRRGIYSKKEFSKRELVTKIYTPAYISFETVLLAEGVIFQYYETLFVASYLTRDLKLKNGQKIRIRKLKNEILLSKKGLIRKNNFFMATVDIAFLDLIYLNRNYYFDNLRKIDFKKCRDIVIIYNNKQLEKKLEVYAKLAKTQN